MTLRSAVLLLFLLCLSANFLAAQSQDTVSNMRMALAQNPLDLSTRLSLAWNLMMQGQYQDAYLQYLFVAQRDSGNADASAGMLWALNAAGKYSRATQEADSLIQRQPHNPALYYHRGIARLNLNRANRARMDGHQALRLASDSYWQDLAKNLLRDSYLALADVPSAKHFSSNPIPGKSLWILDAQWGIKSTQSDTYALGIKALLGTTRLSLKAEELTLDGAHFRYYLHSSLTQQLRGLDLQAQARFLDGTDQRIYPAVGASVGLNPKIYAGPLIITGSFSQSSLFAAQLNSYQSDAGIGLQYAPLSFSYLLSHVYLDADAAGADQTNWVNSLDLSLRWHKGIETAVYAGNGKMAFLQNAYGGITDDFEPAKSFLGISLYSPLGKKLGLMLYGQLNLRPQSSYFFIRGTYRV